MSRPSFIWITEQIHNNDYNFRTLVSKGPKRRNDGVNRWYLFRREFVLDNIPDSAHTKITVDGRYQLFVNQQKIARGPARCNPEFQSYDELDISSFLKRGTNVIGILVHVYGADNAWYQQSQDYWQSIFGDGAVYFETNIQSENQNFVITTDKQWKYCKADAWDSTTPVSGWGQDFIENFDANKFPLNWTSEDFDHSQWNHAVELLYETSDNEKKMGWGNISPFPVLVKNILQPLKEKSVMAEKILQQFRVTPDPSLEFEQRVYKEIFTQVDNQDNLSNLEYLLTDDENCCLMKTSEDQDTAIIIQFDKLYTGYPFIEIFAEGGEIIELAVSETLPGEYTEKGISENRIRIVSHLDCRHLFRYKARKGYQRFEKFEWTAVRYLQIIVRNAPLGLRIRHIGVNTTVYPLQQLGKFECSDKLLNKLWQTGNYTTLLCSHDAWEDCPGREKRQWVGDGMVHYQVSQVCFGDSGRALDKMFLIHSAQSQRNDGLLQMFAPGDHHYHGIVIPDFSLHWISTLYHYLWFTNDIKTTAELFPTMEKILNWFYLQLNEYGALSDLPHWQFIEWANVGREHQATTINALFAGTLKHAAFIAEHIGYHPAKEKILDVCTNITTVLNQHHWDPARKVYIDSFNPLDGTASVQVSQHANALMVVHELAPQHRWQPMMQYITDETRTKLTATPPVVMHEETLNPETDVVQCNTSFAHFLYAAQAKVNQFEKALAFFRNNYGPMLATGTSTLWESFSPDASLCHAFSASPVYYLSREVLGVRPLKPGFEEVVISPKFCGLKSAKGAYPTILGNIEVSWLIVSSELIIDITIPEGISAWLEIDQPFNPSNNSIALETGFQQHRLLSDKKH